MTNRLERGDSAHIFRVSDQHRGAVCGRRRRHVRRATHSTALYSALFSAAVEAPDRLEIVSSVAIPAQSIRWRCTDRRYA